MKNYLEKTFNEIRTKVVNEYSQRIVESTLKYQHKYGFELNYNNGHEHLTWNCEADAFKHAYGSALMALEKGNLYSSLVGLGHEYEYLKNPQKYNNPENEKNMDKHNNKVGLNIANELVKDYAGRWDNLTQKEKEDIIADRVWKHMQAGDLILSPDGRRELNGVNKGSNKKSDTSDRTSCVGSYPVSGYTRSDGIEVKGYTRTCGAKHLSSSVKNGNRSGFAPEQQEIKRDNDRCRGGSGVVMSTKDKQKVLDKYNGKKAQDLSKSEIAEFLKAYL